MNHSLSQRRRHRGFTLIELMITVAIVGILAKVALPSYLDYVKRGKLTEAFNNMSSCSMALSQYYQDNRTFKLASLGTGASNQCATSTTNFTYALSGLTDTGYTLTATGQSGASGFVFTLDNTGLHATTSAPSGWTTSTTCWTSSRSGGCQ